MPTTSVNINTQALAEFLAYALVKKGLLSAYLTIQEAADQTRFSPDTIRKAIKEGRLLAHQPDGREYRIPREALRAWMEGRKPDLVPTKKIPDEEGLGDVVLSMPEEVAVETFPMDDPKTAIENLKRLGWEHFLKGLEERYNALIVAYSNRHPEVVVRRPSETEAKWYSGDWTFVLSLKLDIGEIWIHRWTLKSSQGGKIPVEVSIEEALDQWIEPPKTA